MGWVVRDRGSGRSVPTVGPGLEKRPPPWGLGRALELLGMKTSKVRRVDANIVVIRLDLNGAAC